MRASFPLAAQDEERRHADEATTASMTSFSFAEYPVACCGNEGEENPP